MELSRLLNLTDAPPKRKQDEGCADPQSKSMKTDLEDDSPCELCESVDLVAFFTSTRRTKIPLGSLLHVFGCLACLFANLLQALFEKRTVMWSSPERAS